MQAQQRAAVLALLGNQTGQRGRAAGRRPGTQRTRGRDGPLTTVVGEFQYRPGLSGVRGPDPAQRVPSAASMATW